MSTFLFQLTEEEEKDLAANDDNEVKTEKTEPSEESKKVENGGEAANVSGKY